MVLKVLKAYMKVYRTDTSTIIATQYFDPLLIHLSNQIISHLDRVTGKNLLDIGCGVGRTSIMAAKKGFHVLGVDIEEKAIKLAKQRVKNIRGIDCRFILGDVLKTKRIKDSKFDVVICSEVIEHVKEPEKIIDLAYKVLNRNGFLIITTPHDPKLWSVIDEYAQHVKRFSIKDINLLLRKFSLVDLYTVGFPFMRSLINIYKFIIKARKTSHTANWRKEKSMNNLYLVIMCFLLKFDDIFNKMRLGTTIVVVAKK